MNKLEVQRDKLVIYIWNPETQQRLEEREVIDLFDTEYELRDGRFAKHAPKPLEHLVQLPYTNWGPVRWSLPKHIEWIAENVEDEWNLSFDDEVDWHYGNSFPKLNPRFTFESLSDAVLFKLRWY